MSSGRSSLRWRSTKKGERGQATVEFVLLLPFVVLVLLTVAQLAVVVRDQLVLDSITRDAALAASRSPQQTIPATLRTRVAGVHFQTNVAHGMITVTGHRSVSISLPLVGMLSDSVELSSSTAAVVEPTK